MALPRMRLPRTCEPTVFVPTKKRSSNGWQRQKTPRKPATKFAHLRKKMEKNRIAAKVGKRKKQITTDRRQTMAKKSKSTQSAASIYQ